MKIVRIKAVFEVEIVTGVVVSAKDEARQDDLVRHTLSEMEMKLQEAHSDVAARLYIEDVNTKSYTTEDEWI